MNTVAEIVSSKSFKAWLENEYARRTSFRVATVELATSLSLYLGMNHGLKCDVDPCANERIGGWIVVVVKP